MKINPRSQWAALNPVLIAGEPGVEEHVGNVKIGDGKTPWNGLPYFAAPGYWGSFWDETTQTAAAINTAYAIKLRSVDLSNHGVRIVSDSRMVFDNPGVYSITFSIQFTNSDTQIHDVNVWLRKNDSGSNGDVPASDSRFSITGSHGGVNGNVIGTVNFVLGLVAGDYLELMWATSNTGVSILAEPAQTSPLAHPSIPGIICTAVQVASA